MNYSVLLLPLLLASACMSDDVIPPKNQPLPSHELNTTDNSASSNSVSVRKLSALDVKLNEPLSITLTHASVTDALEHLQSMTGLVIKASENLLNQKLYCTIHARDIPLRSVLDWVVRQWDAHYEPIDGMGIWISREAVPAMDERALRFYPLNMIYTEPVFSNKNILLKDNYRKVEKDLQKIDMYSDAEKVVAREAVAIAGEELEEFCRRVFKPYQLGKSQKSIRYDNDLSGLYMDLPVKGHDRMREILYALRHPEPLLIDLRTPSQLTLPKSRVSFTFDSSTLDEVLRELSQQTDLNFAYDHRQKSLKQVTSLKLTDLPIPDVLDSLTEEGMLSSWRYEPDHGFWLALADEKIDTPETQLLSWYRVRVRAYPAADLLESVGQELLMSTMEKSLSVNASYYPGTAMMIQRYTGYLLVAHHEEVHRKVQDYLAVVRQGGLDILVNIDNLLNRQESDRRWEEILRTYNQSQNKNE